MCASEDANPYLNLTPSSTPSEPKRVRQVAVIYVHGMGSQRRNEETSRLIDALDYYLVSRSSEKDTTGKKKDPTEGLTYENIRVRRLDENTYIRPQIASYRNDVTNEKLEITFFEGYWAPETAINIHSLVVLNWLFKYLWTPLKIIWADWDKYATIKRIALINILHDAWHDEVKDKKIPKYQSRGETACEENSIYEKIGLEKYVNLLEYYIYYNRVDLIQKSNDFLSLFRWNLFLKRFKKFLYDDLDVENANKISSDGIKEVPRFKDVKTHTSLSEEKGFHQSLSDDNFKRKELFDLLKNWIRTFYAMQFRVQFLIILTQLSILGFIAAFFFTGFQLYLYHNFFMQSSNFWGGIGIKLLGLIIFFLLFFYLTPKILNFLSYFLGDVMQWATYNESQVYSRNRKRILNTIKSIFSTAVNSNLKQTDGEKPLYDSVILVGHSLGSAILLDSLISTFNDIQSKISLGEAEKEDFRKVTHLITLGSPIDKIYYYFESHASPFAHHNYFMEQNRGDLKLWRDKNIYKNMNWINFYDCSDIIAGPVFAHNTIANPKSTRLPGELVNHVWNVPINYYTFGSLSKAHGSYFYNVQVISTIWKAIEESSRKTQDLNDRMSLDYYPQIAEKEKFPAKISYQFYSFLALSLLVFPGIVYQWNYFVILLFLT